MWGGQFTPFLLLTFNRFGLVSLKR